MKFISTLLAVLSLLNFTTACLKINGYYNIVNNHYWGTAIDNDVEVCSLDIYAVPTDNPVQYWDCQTGYHAFVSANLATFAYDNPHLKDGRVGLETYVAVTGSVTGFRAQAYGC